MCHETDTLCVCVISAQLREWMKNKEVNMSGMSFRIQLHSASHLKIFIILLYSQAKRLR